MFEEAPVRSRTQEILAHRHESGKIHDGVGGKVMKLCSKEVQESSEKRMRRQRKPAVDVSGEENALTLPRLRLDLVSRKPCRFVGDQSPLNQIVDVVLADRRADLVALDLAWRQARP